LSTPWADKALLSWQASTPSERCTGMPQRKRLSHDARREQITEVTLDLIAEYGVQGATVARIAEGAGVTVPTLYTHFTDRRDILLATVDLVFERIRAIHESSSHTNALERLREIAHYHTRLVASKDNGFVSALFELIAAPPSEGLREAVGAGHLAIVQDLARMVREGQSQGTIVADADPEEVAWLIVSRDWTEDVSELIGTSDHWTAERSNQMLDLVLGSITAVAPGA
jgi:AcrR family transcriptional regulator